MYLNYSTATASGHVEGLVLVYGSPRVARVAKQFPTRTLGGVTFFVEDDLRDAFFVGVAVVVDCLFTFSQLCSPHTQWTMAERALLTMATHRQLIEMELLVLLIIFYGFCRYYRAWNWKCDSGRDVVSRPITALRAAWGLRSFVG